jgi:hypothetical protein
MKKLFKLILKTLKWLVIFCVACVVLLLVFADRVPSDEEIKEKIDSQYAEIKSIPASEPCKNLEGYNDLKNTETKYNTSYYLEITSDKIAKYKSLCSIKKQEIEKEKSRIEEEAKRLEEAKKVGDWNKGYYVDDFGDRTSNGFISQTTKGLFSNSATQNSPLRARMFINNANLEKQTPWFRLYEYDGANPIKGVYSRNTMDCRVKEQDGSIIRIEFSQSQGSDYFSVRSSSKRHIGYLKDLIRSGGVGKFACVDNQFGNAKYVFSFNFKYFNNIVRQFNEGA